MRAMLKHELRSYVHSPASYAVSGLFIAVASIYYYLDNLRGRSGDLSALYSTIATLFLFIVPILTSRTISEERRSGTEILLVTSPTSIVGIVAGKFTAVLLLLIAMLSFTLVFPLFLLLYASIHPLSLFGYYIGLILLGAGTSALGVFCSALTESQVISSLISFTALLILFILRPVGAALGGAAAALFNYISPFARFDEFGRGIFSLQSTLFFVTFAFLFLLLTTCVLSVLRSNASVKGKAYVRVSIVSIVVILIQINLITHLFPLRLDLSAGKRYSLSDTTKELLDRLDSTIAVYGLFDENKADRNYLEVKELLKSYEARTNGLVYVQYSDPDRDPGLISRLDPGSSLSLRNNDFYITDGTNGRRIRYQDLFQLEYDQRTSTWFNVGSMAERAFSDAISSLVDHVATCNKYTGSGYTLYTSGDDAELPKFNSSYMDLLISVAESEVIPLEFFGLYLPSATEFDIPYGGIILAYSPGGKAVAAAWETGTQRNVLVGSSDYLDENTRNEYPASFVTNQYFENSVRDWVSGGAVTEEIAVKIYDNGELQIPRDNADYIGVLTVIVLPAAIFTRGGIVWRRRRYL